LVFAYPDKKAGAIPVDAGTMFKFPALCIKRTNNLADFPVHVNHNAGMQDKTISNALLALRKQIIRGDSDGLAQVETLLRMRSVDMPRVLPAKRSDVARKG
jgi:hypothetical protein